MLINGFTIIDKNTDEYPDCYDIALNEKWAKHLMYCDIDCFAITEDGILILLDECGNCAYCPADRFTVVYENENEEIKRQKHILDSYALQYGSVKDQQKVIDKAKAEAVREFVDKLKCYAEIGKGYLGHAYYSVAVADIDNLLGKMYGKENNDER